MATPRQSRLSWFRLYVDDFLGGICALSGVECGHYVRLLLHQWGTHSKQVIPDDPERLKLICLGETPGPAVLAKFEKVPGGLRNIRLAREYEKTEREYTAKSTKKKAHSTPLSSPLSTSDSEPDSNAHSGTLTPLNQNQNQNITTTDISSDASARPVVLANSVRRIFDHWKATTNHPGAKLTPERERLIRKRLKDGYTEEQLLLAIDGNKASAFHQGQNDRQTVYDKLTLIFRNGENIEKFIEYAGAAALDTDQQPMPWELESDERPTTTTSD